LTVAVTNTITSTTQHTLPAYKVGQQFSGIAAATNSGATTLNISSLGAGAVQVAGSACVGGELLINRPFRVIVTSTTPTFEVVTATTATTALDLSGTPAFFAPITNSLGANVALNNIATLFDGPSVAQGTTGKWFASGTITLHVNSVYGQFEIRLWDGTTIIDAAVHTPPASFTGNNYVPISLSGFISAPAGNLRISVRDHNDTTSVIIFNVYGDNKSSTITAFRIG
jgi:hypothetical protein